MRDLSKLLTLLCELKSLSQNYSEEPTRIRISGDDFNESIRGVLSQILGECHVLGISEPTVLISGDYLDEDDLCSTHLDGDEWNVFFGKNDIASSIEYREHESKYIFLSITEFNKWIVNYDPFLFEQPQSLQFDSKTTIVIVGLEHAFGNKDVWFIPYGMELPIDFNDDYFPTGNDVSSIVRVSSSNGIRLRPELFCITWGDYQFESSLPVIKKFSEILIACLSQELKVVAGRYHVTIRGAKKVTFELSSQDTNVSLDDFHKIMSAVKWVYAERAETRLQLITDRLSIDADSGKCYLFNVCEHIDFALSQAKDSYAFVILDRKDAYYKELREIMKDMKSQADLYAAKVRDLISSLARDILGVLLFVSMSFIGKFDRKQIQELLGSNEAGLMLKCISIYLLITCFVTIFIHWRDVTLSYRESRTWLTVLQQYSSSEDRVQRFIEPLTSRLITLFIVGAFTAIVYIVLAIIVWNLQFVVELLLSQ